MAAIPGPPGTISGNIGRLDATPNNSQGAAKNDHLDTSPPEPGPPGSSQNTRGEPRCHVWNENGRRRVLGAQSINAEKAFKIWRKKYFAVNCWDHTTGCKHFIWVPVGEHCPPHPRNNVIRVFTKALAPLFSLCSAIKTWTTQDSDNHETAFSQDP